MRALIILFLWTTAFSSLCTLRAESDSLPQMAWRQINRDQNGNITTVEVVVVDGKRWRFEGLSSRKHWLIGVSDGTAAASNLPKPSPESPPEKLNPIPSMLVMWNAVKHTAPEATERIDGHDYLRFTQNYNGASMRVWADPKTRFPFRLHSTGTKEIDVTYVLLPEAVFKISNLFSVDALKPLLSEYAKKNE